jgi:hypothetical protein
MDVIGLWAVWGWSCPTVTWCQTQLASREQRAGTGVLRLRTRRFGRSLVECQAVTSAVGTSSLAAGGLASLLSSHRRRAAVRVRTAGLPAGR